ncbi:LuxR C-terminal-related transcriptional regulator [Bradyrhizobium septentrionale]|uniref:Response regulator transcription factor n=1 Tax=Bradyrhizobium septentrionale TaxID=1404411 RepID=A0ABZ2NUL0_9BRAD|nr:response regulator transcription factor [Bradyrhizobium septentrionale]UGY17330.1 response regulator transcription factor [Bradyrhizobium septentrionale]UGY26074.1 response regulator transcription factor [Bradyrhizobium septentrionale]
MNFSRVVIASRYPVVLLGLNCLLEAERDFKVVARCNDGASCFKAIRSLAPDIAILDMSMPDIFAQATPDIANSGTPGVRLVFLATSVEDRDLAMLAAAGAYGVILSEEEPETLIQMLRQVADGQRMLPPPASEEVISRAPTAIPEKYLAVLTERERQIMRLVSEGLSNKEIGRRLKVADGTIKVHLHHIFRKLEISNRTVLATLAISSST